MGLVDLSLEVEEGQIFGLLGPNGSGKTTTLKLLLGLIFPTSGSGEIFGHPLGSAAYKERVGFLPEGPYFYEHLNSVELLRFYGGLFGMSGTELESRIQHLLELVGMWERRRMRVRDYSQGMRQRVGAAQAMINDPDLLFLDELTSGLDPLGSIDMNEMVQNLRDEGKTIFLCSHLLKDMEPICDRVIILNEGEACKVGRVEDLLKVEGEYRMVVSEASEELVERLTEQALRTEQRAEGFVSYYPDQQGVVAAADAATKAGGHIEDISVHQRTLEEVFIDAVGGRD